MPDPVPLEIEEGREQRMQEQTLEAVIAGDVPEHVHLANRPAFVAVVFRENVVRHQAAVVELDRALIRPLLPRLQTVVKVVRQRALRDVRDGRYVELVHVADVAAVIKEQRHRFATTRPGRVVQRRVAFVCKSRCSQLVFYCEKY